MKKNKQNKSKKIKWVFNPSLHIGVGKSLLIWFLIISLVPLAIVTYINYMNAFKSLTIVTQKSLLTTSELRVEYINSFFGKLQNDIIIQSKLHSNISFLKKLERDYKTSGFTLKKYIKSNRWEKINNKKKSDFEKIKNLQGYYDIIFIDFDGNILYSLSQEDELGTNIYTGKYAHTLFGKTCKKVLETGKTLFSDLEHFKPSNNEISGFFVKLIRDNDNKKLGLLVFQISANPISRIIQNQAGLGETGVAYIIGEDLLLRSSTRFEDKSAILKKKVKNANTKKWLESLKYNENLSSFNNNGNILAYQNNKKAWVYGVYRKVNKLSELGVHWAIFEELNLSEAFLYNKSLKKTFKITLIITTLIIIFISIIITMRFVYPLKQLSAWAKQVAVGELINKNIRAPKNEVGEMKDAFNSLVKSLQSLAVISESIAIGDFSKKFNVRSKNDVLGKSMNQMIDNFREVVEQSNTIAKGDYSSNVVPRSNKDSLGIALYQMTKTLRETSQEINKQDWLKTGIANLNEKISGKKDIPELTQEIISFLVKYLKVQIGLLYLLEGDNYLYLKASYAFYKHKNKFKKFNIGEGLIGQAAKDKQLIELSNVKNNMPPLNYGVDEKIPEYFIASPFIYEKKLVGVIELGSITKFTELQKMFLEICMENIAVSVYSAQAHAKLQRLLEQTQEQKEKLQVQQEELRQSNEELEEQTEALKASEESLQTQKEELSVTNEELEERTQALEIEKNNIKIKNEELRKVKDEIAKKAKEVELASKYKSEFLANMSHELRTPLNSILILSQLLYENNKNNLYEKQIEFAKTINSSGKDLLSLINQILDLSKIEAGKLDINIDRMYFSLLKKQIEKTFEPLILQKGLKIKIDIQKELPEFMITDTQRVYQIITNLLSNAIKFTSKGGVTVNIYRPKADVEFHKHELKAESTIAFDVSDTGIGIPEDKKEIIFEAFQQADGTTSRKYGGTGLGLSISKSLASLLGGEIHLKSKQGFGTIFTLYLPEKLDKKISVIKKEEKTLTKIHKIKEPGKYTKVNKLIPLPKDLYDDRESIKKGDKFILVIEDDPAFLKILYDLAKEKGFKTMIAMDGETGIYYADFYQPSALILDVGLPGIDGWEVMKRLKANPKTHDIPVHFITVSTKKEDAMKMGAIGFLTKPVSIEKLNSVFSKIKDIISKPLKKLLIIDDEEVVRKSILELIKKENGHVQAQAVADGNKAFDLIKKESYDCVILDLGLKDMSGFDLLEKIRKNKNISYMPIIIYTGKELSKQEEERLQKYADSIIVKGPRSLVRLSDEAKLFLHHIDANITAKKHRIIENFNHKEAVFKDKKILIVDDDMRSVFALSSILEEKGLKIIIGKNGKEGIEKLHKNPDIDLILMDIMMPEMNGYEAMREIRKDIKYSNLPIIALTAKAMKDDRVKCIDAGANEYLAKPVDTDKLFSLLRVWLYK